MENYKSVKNIALYDSFILIKNTYNHENGQKWNYEHPFHTTDLGVWEIEGSDISNILSHMNIEPLSSMKMEREKYPIFKGCRVFGEDYGKDYKIINVSAKIEAPFLLSIKILMHYNKKKEILDISYCGKFSIEWQSEKVEKKVSKKLK